MIRDTRAPLGRVVRTMDATDLPDIYNAPASPANRAQLADRREGIESGRMFATFRPAWFGGIDSLEAARALLTDGWPEGAEQLAGLAGELRELIPEPVPIRRRPVWSDDGDTIDIDRAWAGQWETAYRTTKRQASTTPREVTLALTWGGHWKESADRLFWAGAAVVALADAIEAAGYLTSIVALYPVNDSLTIVNAKHAGEPLRVDSLAATFCHAGVYRTFGIPAAACNLRAVGKTWGRVVYAPPLAESAKALGLLDAATLILPPCRTRDCAAAAIRQALATLTGPEANGDRA